MKPGCERAAADAAGTALGGGAVVTGVGAGGAMNFTAGSSLLRTTLALPRTVSSSSSVISGIIA
jgi:hypothetical protein